MSDQNPNPDDQNDQKPDGTEATTGTPPQQGDSPKVTFTPEQQAEINKMIGNARREGKQSAEAEATAAKAAADAAAERDRQVKAGEFDQVRTSLEKERDDAASDRDDYKSRFDKVIEAIKPSVDEQWKTLPEEVKELYEGADDDVMAMQSHITRHKKLIDRLTANQEQAKQAAGFGRTPTPQGTKQEDKGLVGSVRF